MKKVVMIFLCLSSALSYGQSLQDSLLVYYPMDGNSLDSSGNGYNATTNASLAPDRWGSPNRAYHFNGTNQYFDLPFSPDLQPPLPVSVAFWVRFDNFGVPLVPIFDSDFNEDNYTGILIDAFSQHLVLNYGDGGGYIGPGTRRTKTGTTTFSSGVWYFVICIIRGPVDMDIYVDCANDGGAYSGTGGSLAYTPNAGSLGRLDADMLGPPDYFGGYLDDFRFWNRALTASDINELCKITGIDNVAENEIKLFPNPVNDYLSIENLPDDAFRIDIFNTLGMKICSSTLSNPVFVGSLSKGLYLVRFVDKAEKTIYTSKFFKN